MKPEQAIQVLADVAAQFKGSLQDHQTLQEAVKVLREANKPKK